MRNVTMERNVIESQSWTGDLIFIELPEYIYSTLDSFQATANCDFYDFVSAGSWKYWKSRS